MFGFAEPCGYYYGSYKDDSCLADEEFPVLMALARLRDSGLYEVIDQNPLGVQHIRLPQFNQPKRDVPENFNLKGNVAKKHRAVAGRMLG